MNQEDIIPAFEKRFNRVKKVYRRTIATFDVDTIHDFRVEVKKLRALNNLINAAATKKGQLKISKRIKDFYHKAGDVRQLQLQQKKISDLCAKFSLEEPTLYLQLIEDEKTKLLKQLQSDGKISFKKFYKKSTDLLQSKINFNAYAFVSQSNTRLLNLLNLQHPREDDLHDLRKTLKDILYNWQYIQWLVKETFPSYLACKDNVQALTTKLGDFHDLCNDVSLLTPDYIDRIMNHEEKAILFFLKNQMERQQVIMFQDLTSLMKRLLKTEKKQPEVCEVF